MINAKELIARLEMMITSYGENCELDTFSGSLDVYDENGSYVQSLEV